MRLVQFWNALSPTDVIFFGKATFSNFAQLENVSASIAVISFNSDRSTETNPELLNAAASIVFTVVGIKIFDSAEQSVNAYLPIEVRFSDRTTLFNDVHPWNVISGIAVIELGKTTFFNEEHPIKALLPIEGIAFENDIVDNDTQSEKAL
jgi:hypothetical protein